MTVLQKLLVKFRNEVVDKHDKCISSDTVFHHITSRMFKGYCTSNICFRRYLVTLALNVGQGHSLHFFPQDASVHQIYIIHHNILMTLHVYCNLGQGHLSLIVVDPGIDRRGGAISY